MKQQAANAAGSRCEAAGSNKQHTADEKQQAADVKQRATNVKQPKEDAVANITRGGKVQSDVDAVVTKAKNSWDTKRKNAQKARKRRVMSMIVNGCN